MNPVLARFYEKIKMEPCLVCGKFGVDVAHLLPISKPLGLGNNGPYRDWSSRSHKDARAFTAIPLCRKCHDSVHALSEAWLDDALEGLGGRIYAYAYALRLLGEAIMEVTDAETDNQPS